MRRPRITRSIVPFIGLLLWGAGLPAQQWNDARTRSLVERATERRAQQLADSGLVDYRATAHGYLTFLAQLGEGMREPPRVVKADELALEVYWRAPNLSKQHIIGRRDTTLLPTDIAYHRDHLGIIQNNFPAIIRLGDGDEVRDVPHPLSRSGLREYDFAIADSLRIIFPGRDISVYEVKVRPRDDRQPRVIGALYLDRDNGQVVRMALSFTAAAFLDRQLEDLFVVLENGLVGASWWLPRRQEIEIRRSATWLDYPVRGIIRGRWEIRDYELNPGLPTALFAGPEIVAVRPPGAPHPWPSANILDSLPPDVRAVTPDEIRRVRAEVRTLVRAQVLQRSRGVVPAARGISDFVRFNRVEGLAFGAGATLRTGAGVALTARGRFGLADERAKGAVLLSWQRASGTRIEGSWRDDFRDVGDLPERSGVFNSLAAQEWGSDATDPYRATGPAVAFGMRRLGGDLVLAVSRERHQSLAVNAAPARGTFRPTVPVADGHGTRASLRFDLPTTLVALGFEARLAAEGRVTWYDPAAVTRTALQLELERPMGSARWMTRTLAGAARSSQAIVPQDLIYLGGPVSAPGYEPHALVAERSVAQRLEVQLPVPFPQVSLGSFGRSAARASLAPHATLVARAGHRPNRAIGVSLLLGFDILRIDVSRGLDDGGRWMVTVDAARAFWSIL